MAALTLNLIKHIRPAWADDMGPQIIIEFESFTLDFVPPCSGTWIAKWNALFLTHWKKNLGFWSSCVSWISIPFWQPLNRLLLAVFLPLNLSFIKLGWCTDLQLHIFPVEGASLLVSCQACSLLHSFVCQNITALKKKLICSCAILIFFEKQNFGFL